MLIRPSAGLTQFRPAPLPTALILLFLLLLALLSPLTHFSVAKRMEERGRKSPWTRKLVANNLSKHRLTLCDYYRELGIDWPGCGKKKKRPKGGKKKLAGGQVALLRRIPEIEAILITASPPTTTTAIAIDNYRKFEGIGNYPSCQGYFSNCRPSDHCLSGFVCTSRLTRTKCCKLFADSQCPASEKLGYSCLQKNPVSWCNVNSDCANNLLRSHICCPTGCGYNICLSNVNHSPPSRRLQQIEEKLSRQSADCPSPFLIRLNCILPKSSSLCHSARDCPTYDPKYPRRCCLTPCGNNICLTKFEDGWIII